MRTGHKNSENSFIVTAYLQFKQVRDMCDEASETSVKERDMIHDIV